MNWTSKLWVQSQELQPTDPASSFWIALAMFSSIARTWYGLGPCCYYCRWKHIVHLLFKIPPFPIPVNSREQLVEYAQLFSLKLPFLSCRGQISEISYMLSLASPPHYWASQSPLILPIQNPQSCREIESIGKGLFACRKCKRFGPLTQEPFCKGKRWSWIHVLNLDDKAKSDWFMLLWYTIR